MFLSVKCRDSPVVEGEYKGEPHGRTFKKIGTTMLLSHMNFTDGRENENISEHF